MGSVSCALLAICLGPARRHSGGSNSGRRVFSACSRLLRRWRWCWGRRLRRQDVGQRVVRQQRLELQQRHQRLRVGVVRVRLLKPWGMWVWKGKVGHSLLQARQCEPETLRKEALKLTWRCHVVMPRLTRPLSRAPKARDHLTTAAT